MESCECYEERTKIIGWLSPDEVIRKTVAVCNGTKEQDVCSCGGNPEKCNFYPQVKEKALKEQVMKVKLLINGKELDVEITEEELKKIEAKSAKKTGYERVEDGQCFWFDVDSVVHPDKDVYGDEERERSYEVANYYSNFEVATNNARADKLMRQVRRFAVEHREKELNWCHGEQKKYTISYDYDDNTFGVDWWFCSSEFGTMYFDSEETAELAIETFRDELLWYFTEYEDSL